LKDACEHQNREYDGYRQPHVAPKDGQVQDGCKESRDDRNHTHAAQEEDLLEHFMLMGRVCQKTSMCLGILAGLLTMRRIRLRIHITPNYLIHNPE